MTRLILDEAIRRVLTEARAGLTVAQITQAIRDRKLYLRQDGQPPEPSQVSVRIHGRPALFQVDKSTYPSTIYLRDEADAGKPRPRVPVHAQIGGKADATINVTDEWWWEGNVQARVVEYLIEEGWTVRSKADTVTRARGADILASRDGRTLIVEVKGYPSTRYRSGTKAGQPKPTNPRLQAKHWYAEALLSTILHRESNPDSAVALALPNVDRYRDLVNRTERTLRDLGLGVYLVPEAGAPIRRIVQPSTSSDLS